MGYSLESNPLEEAEETEQAPSDDAKDTPMEIVEPQPVGARTNPTEAEEVAVPVLPKPAKGAPENEPENAPVPAQEQHAQQHCRTCTCNRGEEQIPAKKPKRFF